MEKIKTIAVVFIALMATLFWFVTSPVAFIIGAVYGFFEKGFKTAIKWQESIFAYLSKYDI